jgi:uncharacterized membrane protein YidH (DUF202 family)
VFLEADFMLDEREQEILATVRTLLALERNYLAEERTELAEFRTGLAILLVVPAASTVIAFASSLLDGTFALISNVLSFGLFAVLVVWGVWTIIRSRSKLKRIRANKKRLKARECEFVSKSKTINDLISECIIFEDVDKEG